MLAFQGAVVGRNVEVVQALTDPGSPGGFVVTGVNKLAQRLLILLLTERGSLRYLPEVGTFLITDARLGLWRTLADVQQSAHSALLDVRRQLVLAESEDDPADEKVDNIELLSATLQGDRASLHLQVSSLAGDTRAFIAPLSFVVQE